MTHATPKPNQSQKERLNIAFFIDWIEREYQMRLINGVIDSARRQGVNLYCLEGGFINNKPDEFDRNQLYKLVNEHNVDGLILSSASIGHLTSAKELTQFCRQYYPLPIVSISTEIEGCASVLIDNSGLQDAIIHLIQVHHYQKFAIITGPKTNRDAISRLEIFQQTLAKYNVPLDPALIVEGNFWRISGEEAVRILLDERKANFDVIVASNDEMALGALNELQARGIKVPTQVAIIGFDNLQLSACSKPPLTTVSDSLHELGVKALELVVNLIANRTVPQKLYIPSQLVLRESCGCLSQTVLHYATSELTTENKMAKSTFLKNKDLLKANILTKLQTLGHQEIDLSTVDILLDGLQLQMQDESNASLIQTFYQLINEHPNMHFWHNFLSLLIGEILPYIDSNHFFQVDMIFHQLRLMISEKANLQEKINYYDALNRHYITNQISGHLLDALDVAQVMRILKKELPLLGVTTCCLSEYNIYNHEYTVMMAYNRQGNINFGETVFSDSLIPEELKNDGEPHIFLISMVYCTNNKFRNIAVEFEKPITDVYAALMWTITCSLWGFKHMEELCRQETQLIYQQEQLLAQSRKAIEGFIQTILSMMEARDPYTAGHQSRVADLACAIAKKMDLSQEMIEGLRMAGIIHDMGKITVPFEILNKPRRLKPTELDLIKEHPLVAYEILKNMEFPWPIAQIVVQHHERIDGSGYPKGLHGSEILMEAKILAVADVIEAMASHRPYRPSLGITKALEEIKINRGNLYDNEIVDTCLHLFNVNGYTIN
jgi:DNA-binding LacI/PurR family transcriptional regulator